MIKDFKCGQCNTRVLGKLHKDGKLIIQHKGLRIQVENNSSLLITCPLCGGENIYTQKRINIEELYNG